jgi:hypothetical protein
MPLNIKAEIEYLKKRFKLKTKFIVDKKLLKKQKSYALYCFNNDEIIIPDLRYSHMRIWTILHEIGHALQAKEDRHSFTKVRYYSEEIEAELFAAHYAEKIYGIRKVFWNLADYDQYCKTPIKNASPDQFLNRFRHLIEPATLKSINKYLRSTNRMRLDKKKTTCERKNKLIFI